MLLTGRTALITGGGRGIGRAIATRLAREGAKLVVTARDVATLDDVVRETGATPLALDLEDRPALEPWARRVASEHGPIHILINNAGVADSSPFDRTTDSSWDRAFAVNATAPFVLCRALVPQMIAEGFGRIVQIASNAGLIGYAYTAAYVASKHALVGLTRALALEIARTGVTVNAVCPGWVDTGMAGDAARHIARSTGRSEEDARAALASMSPQKRFMHPDEVAHVVAMLCAPEAAGITGQAIPIDGGQVMK